MVGIQIHSVVIDRADRVQTKFQPGDRIISHREPVELDGIPDVLADPAGWIEYDTEARQGGDVDDDEPWRQDEDRLSLPARARLYARSVVEIMVIYDA